MTLQIAVQRIRFAPRACAGRPPACPSTCPTPAAAPEEDPPHHAARLLDAQAAGATDRELQRATADVLGEVYFRDGGHRAHGLDVELTDMECVEFEL
ncbi:hypothetical protein [Streptomyces hydrogenans]|uniref:hypothetical protein n=1 Tax=Streptomyces hydrogenans TaxID=1873719 RepID=UPI003F58C6DE